MRLAPMPFRERLARMVANKGEDECWDWPGFCVDGYGKVGANIDHRGWRVWFAHRAAYTLLVGTVPEQFELDHLCRNRRCMNPWHLEPVTPRENTMRSEAPTAHNARKTHCKHGHPLTADNIYVTTTKYGTIGRACMTCAKAWGIQQGVERRTYARGHKPFCVRGHPLAGDNLEEYWSPDGRLHRRCKTCIRAGDARRHREKRAKRRRQRKKA